MGWQIALVNARSEASVSVEPQESDPAHALGSMVIAECGVTYNYGVHFEFGALAGRSGRQSCCTLAEAVGRLGTVQAEDYWEATEGNAGYACSVLLSWARQHPHAIWEVDGYRQSYTQRHGEWWVYARLKENSRKQHGVV